MERRQLGQTGLEVGVLGLGTEYLFKADRQTVVDVIAEAVDHGINFIDVLGPHAGYRDNIAAAISGRRDGLVLQAHLGGVEAADGQWETSRDPAACERYFHDLLTRLGTDHVDVLNITVVDRADDYEQKVVGPGGVLELAQRLKREGKARAISMSTHTSATGLKAVKSGLFDSLMIGLNMNWPQPEVTAACAESGIGLVAMKPYNGGELFFPPFSNFITPVKALAYNIEHPGVTVTIPGAKNLQQLRDALAYLTASPEEREYASIMANFRERILGHCVGCNHCLPCAAGIDIGTALTALQQCERNSDYWPSIFKQLAVPPTACLGCGDCLSRCAFKVDIIGRMKRAGEVFSTLG